MDNIAQFALVALTSLLFIVDPVAVVPAYLVITGGETAAEQRKYGSDLATCGGKSMPAD
jgi:small neutral amino acid transporter SnatA (MarC family)